MKFRVKVTLKSSSIGYIREGHYDTENPNFPAELKELLIAEAGNGRNLVEITDPNDTAAIIEEEGGQPPLPDEQLDSVPDDGGASEPTTTPQPDKDPVPSAESTTPPTPKLKPIRKNAKTEK